MRRTACAGCGSRSQREMTRSDRCRRASSWQASAGTAGGAARRDPETSDAAATRPPAASRGRNRREEDPTNRLSDVLEVFTRLEADRATWRDAHFFARPWIAADAALPRLHLEHAEPAQLDALAALHGDPHRIEDGVDRHLGFYLGNVGYFRHFVDDVDLDHA